MAGSKSDSLESRILNALFKNTAITSTASVYVRLMTDVPTDSTAGTEVNGSGYVSGGVAVAAANWTVSGTSPTQVQNNAEIAFATVATVSYTVRGWEIWDSNSGGNRLYWGDCTQTTMNIGDTPRFAANQLTVTED
jgi:hypothetical protein